MGGISLELGLFLESDFGLEPESDWPEVVGWRLFPSSAGDVGGALVLWTGESLAEGGGGACPVLSLSSVGLLSTVGEWLSHKMKSVNPGECIHY